jgi:mandelamide amidase
VLDVMLFDSVVTTTWASAASKPLKGARIGTSEYLMQGIDRECGRIVATAFDKLRDAGVELVPTELPPSLRAASDIEVALLGYELLDGLSAFLAKEGTGVSLDELIAAAGANLKPLLVGSRNPGSAGNYRALSQKQKQMRADAIEFFRANRIDALAFAPSLTPAFPQGDPSTLTINGQAVPLFTSIGRQAAIGSCASLSCLVLPAGMTSGGLPVGLEFDAPPNADRELLELGLLLERVLGRMPPPPL